MRKEPSAGLSDKRDSVSGFIPLYDFLDPSAPQAPRANLNGPGCPLDQGLYTDEIGAENALGLHTDVLPNATFFLGLTLPGNAVAGHCSLSTHLTSPSHSYIHLVLNVHIGH